MHVGSALDQCGEDRGDVFDEFAVGLGLVVVQHEIGVEDAPSEATVSVGIERVGIGSPFQQLFDERDRIFEVFVAGVERCGPQCVVQNGGSPFIDRRFLDVVDFRAVGEQEIGDFKLAGLKGDLKRGLAIVLLGGALRQTLANSLFVSIISWTVARSPLRMAWNSVLISFLVGMETTWVQKGGRKYFTHGGARQRDATFLPVRCSRPDSPSCHFVAVSLVPSPIRRSAVGMTLCPDRPRAVRRVRVSPRLAMRAIQNDRCSWEFFLQPDDQRSVACDEQ